jgi:hypothetical protein
MKKKLFLVSLTFVLLFSLAFGACGKPGHVTVPVDADWLPTVGQAHNSDDIVVTLSGPSYAGNTHSANTTGNLEPVNLVQATLSHGSIVANITYRAAIESQQPALRNNIINVYLTGTGAIQSQPTNAVESLGIYTVNLPDGVTVTESGELYGPLSTSSVLVLDISADAKVGRHDFEIGLVINNIDYGTLPCTLTVTG